MADSTAKDRIEVGDWVLVPLGGDPLEGQVIEDCGNLGVDGERILAVLVPWEEGVEPREYGVPEHRLIRPT
jgi:hypothetical protein